VNSGQYPRPRQSLASPSHWNACSRRRTAIGRDHDVEVVVAVALPCQVEQTIARGTAQSDCCRFAGMLATFHPKTWPVIRKRVLGGGGVIQRAKRRHPSVWAERLLSATDLFRLGKSMPMRHAWTVQHGAGVIAVFTDYQIDRVTQPGIAPASTVRGCSRPSSRLYRRLATASFTVMSLFGWTARTT
jgi:hypothetical protein